MNGKYIFALFVALQVTVSLCEIPDADPALVAKYEALKNTFYSRLLAAYHKAQAAAVPYVEMAAGNPHVQAAKVYADELKAYPQAQNAAAFITNLAGEAAPVVDKARHTVLALYGQYLRPQVGEGLDAAIGRVTEFLNTHLPAE